MKSCIRTSAWLLLALTAVAAEPATSSSSGLRLTLPPVIHAVAGVETAVYFRNLILTTNTQLSFEVTCTVGSMESNRWRINATPQQTGDHPLTVRVLDSDGKRLDQASTRLHVVRADAGKDREIRLLIVGDSLTSASAYPNEVARLLSLPGNPKWQMLGTHHPGGAASNVWHEGYGGWTWRSFNSRFEPTRPGPGTTNSSPFVFLSMSEPPKPGLDVPRYLKERCDGRIPDYVTFLLGINDCFRLKAEDPKAMDAGIDAMFKEAETLLSEFRKAAPKADFGICLTTPPNDRDAAFVANYKTNYPRWNWRQVQHRIVERQLEHFGGREREGIFIVPTEVNLDTFSGYPDNNAVHPNTAGYQQIGTTLHAWLKSRLESASRP